MRTSTTKRVKKTLTSLTVLSTAACAQCGENIPAMVEIMQMLQKIGYAIAVFMFAYLGIKWMLAEGPADRENARRGIIYIIIGLMLLRAGVPLVYFLLCF